MYPQQLAPLLTRIPGDVGTQLAGTLQDFWIKMRSPTSDPESTDRFVRILIVSINPQLEQTGIGKNIGEIAAWLGDLSCKVTEVTPSPY